MKLNNCLLCCCSKDCAVNWKEKCIAKRHVFNISEAMASKYNWAIDYIKSELKTGRDISACLGSAGYTFLDDIERLANYSYAIGDKEFHNLIKDNKHGI